MHIICFCQLLNNFGLLYNIAFDGERKKPWSSMQQRLRECKTSVYAFWLQAFAFRGAHSYVSY